MASTRKSEEKKNCLCASCASCDTTEIRKKRRSPEEQAALKTRLNRIEGQLRGIRRMVEENAYCPDILIQVSAATAAMASFSKELLAAHVRTCVTNDIRAGHEEAIDEFCVLLQRMMK